MYGRIVHRTVQIELRCYGWVREAIGTKTADLDLPDGATVGDAFDRLEGEYPAFGEVRDGGKEVAVVLVNGTHVRHLDGRTTTLEAGDAITVSGRAMPE